MKKAVQKVQSLRNMSKIIAAGDQATTLRNIIQAFEEKKQEDLLYLEKHLLKIFPLFNQIKKYLKSQNKFTQLISLLELEFFNHNQIVFNLGEIGRKMYFVLSGKLLIFPYDQRDLNNHQPSRELQIGDHFGEISLHHRIPRTITVQCAEDSVLLSANFEIYSNFIQYAVERIITDQYRFIKDLSIFRGWSSLTLSLILHHLKEIVFLRNQFIYQEGQKDQSLYIIRSGEIILSKYTTLNTKKIENGLICLTQGQCFGDFEFIEDQKWVNNKDQIKNIVRQITAKSTTETKLYSLHISSYLCILQEYHNHTLQYFLSNSKQIIQLRLNDINKKNKEKKIQLDEETERNQEIIEIKALKAAYEVIPPPPISLDEEQIAFQAKKNPYLSLMTTIRSSFSNSKKQLLSQQQQSSPIKFHFTPRLEPTLMKFDRGHQILLLKKLKDASILPDTKDNFIYQKRTILSSFSRLRISKRNQEQESGTLVKSFHNSRANTPDCSTIQNNDNQNSLQKSKRRTSSFKLNDIHNFQVRNNQIGFPRSMSQISLNRGGSVHRKQQTKYKFELELEQNNSYTIQKPKKIDLCVYGKQ